MVAAALNVTGAGFSHGSTRVLSGVNLEVLRGETFCLLGPNGCGKTTLINCILGIDRLDRGRILIDGMPLNRMTPAESALKMAYVPQTHTRHFSFSVMDILLTGRTAYTRFWEAPDRADKDRAEALLAALDLVHLKDRDYTRLSGGEVQLVMVLRALIQETPMILMDEPTAHLDFKNELLVMETITRLIQNNRITLVMATHFPNHAFYLESAGLPVRVGFMEKGRVIDAGPPAAALTPENLERFYGIQAAVITNDIPGRGQIRQVVPLSTTGVNR